MTGVYLLDSVLQLALLGAMLVCAFVSGACLTKWLESRADNA